MGTERMNRMLDQISPRFDTSTGSFFYDNFKAVDIEFDKQEKEINDIIENKAFADTAKGEYLERIASERGIIRREATRATGTVTLTGQYGFTIESGAKVASNTVTYTIQENATIGETNQVTVDIAADELGRVGNAPVGAITEFPSSIPGVSAVTNNVPIENGYNEETIEELRDRYFESLQRPSTSGNKYDYRNWAKEVVGVGDARVYPLHDGPGTVKVTIIDANMTAAEQELIDEVYAHIEKNRPIGAEVTVESALEVPVDIAVNVHIASGYEMEDIESEIQEQISSYFRELAFEENYISYAKVGSIILSNNKVLDYEELTINGQKINIDIGDDELAVVGNVNIN